MRQIPGYILLISCLLIYCISSRNSITHQLEARKFKPGAIPGSDRYRYGDLYGFARLSRFRQKEPAPSQKWNIDSITPRKLHLFIVCDSYIWSFLDDAKYFSGVQQLSIAKTNIHEQLTIAADDSLPRVLLIEIVERNLRDLLGSAGYTSHLFTPITTAADPAEPGGDNKSISTQKTLPGSIRSVLQQSGDIIAFKDINKNLESNIWDYSFFTPVKEFKADLNYTLFGTLDKNVMISANGQQLYFSQTIDTSKFSSSFKFISEAEINLMVNNLNGLYRQAQELGFKKIWLSIVPNPVSVLEPGYNGLTYNHAASRIQNSTALKMPYIDLLPAFTQLKDKVYRKADSHWNEKGISTWLELFNKALRIVQKDQ